MSTNPRTIATAARGAVIMASGVALGAMSAHIATQATIAAAQSPATQAREAKPKVVTKRKVKHVPSDPITVYRDTTSSSAGAGGGGQGSGGSAVAPAPQAPAPAPAPAKKPAATSGQS